MKKWKKYSYFVIMTGICILFTKIFVAHLYCNVLLDSEIIIILKGFSNKEIISLVKLREDLQYNQYVIEVPKRFFKVYLSPIVFQKLILSNIVFNNFIGYDFQNSYIIILTLLSSMLLPILQLWRPFWKTLKHGRNAAPAVVCVISLNVCHFFKFNRTNEFKWPLCVSVQHR